MSDPLGVSAGRGIVYVFFHRGMRWHTIGVLAGTGVCIGLRHYPTLGTIVILLMSWSIGRVGISFVIWVVWFILPSGKTLYACPKCGYDIRETPHQCPKCGTALAWGMRRN